MALNIKNAEVESLAAEISQLTGESKTEAIRKALADRKVRLSAHVKGVDRREKLFRFLENHIWPNIPSRHLGRKLTKKEREEILGYGRGGV
jgi:antitoxin VapB